jgi:general secretion pathway protein L
MSNVLQTGLRGAKELLARSQIGAFFSWWKDELLGCLPKSLRERVSTAPAQLRLGQLPDGRWLASRVRGAKREAERPLELSDVAGVRRALSYLEALNDQPAETKVLVLGPDKVLRKRLTLPLAAEENLLQVLGFEMDRQTPFKAEQVYFDWRVVKRDTAQRSLLVDLVATPKATLDAAIAALAPAQINLDAADALAGRGTQDSHFEQTMGFNLLPSSQRGATGDPQARVRWILAFSVLGLVGLLMRQSLDARQTALEALQVHTTEVQKAALATAAQAKKLREEIAGANFLADRKQKRPETVKVLLELTQLIPDNTWLERISFVGEAVQLQGQSTSASDLIKLLQSARYVRNPQIQGVIQPDAGTGKERFSLQLDLREEAPLPEEPASAPPAGAPSDKPVAPVASTPVASTPKGAFNAVVAGQMGRAAWR